MTNENWANLVSAFGGAIVGGVFALAGAWLSDRLNRKNAARNSEETRRRFLLAVLDEIQLIWQEYYDDIGIEIEKLELRCALEFHYPIFDEIGPIYRHNLPLVLEMDDGNLRRLIVTTYTKLGILMESIRFNNELLRSLELAEERSRLARASHRAAAVTFTRMKSEEWRCRKQLTDYGDSLREHHRLMKEKYYELIDTLHTATKTDG